MRRAPAAIPAALLLLACAAAPGLLPTPAWAVAGLLAAAIAWGGRTGAALAAVATGLLLGDLRRAGEPLDVDGRVAEVEGRICGVWRLHDEFPGRSARLCGEWVQIGRQRILVPPRLWLDLPATGAPPAVGERVRARGALTRFGGLANAHAAPPGPWRLRVKSFAHLRRTGSAGRFARVNAAIRASVERAVAATGRAERPGVALARALVLGDDAALGEERRRALRRVGLAHLFAVSGFNLTLVAGFAAIVAGGGGRALRVALPAIAVLTYLAAVGPEPSMLRASVMSGLGLLILLLRRWVAAAQTLALAGAALVIADPAIVDDVGFQLSFGATAGLVAAARGWSASLTGLPRPVAAALATSCAAQAGALPFTLAAFGEVAPLGPLWNLVAVPWAALWLLVGMVWLAMAVISPTAAAVVAPVLEPAVWPFAAIESLPPSPWLSFAQAGGLAAGLALAVAMTVFFAFATARRLSFLALTALFMTGAPPLPSPIAEVAFFDVAQGDAALVRTARFSALVDGGGLTGRDLGAAALRPALARRGLTRLDVAILSHSDRDHCQGLLDLAATVPIGELWSSPGQLTHGCGARLAERLGGRTRPLVAGVRLERGGIEFEVWHPGRAQGAESSNAESVVVAARLGGRRFVFTGDVAAAQERQALSGVSAPAAAVLKVAHHGAASSTSRDWVERLRPRLAVVSVGGRNPYGHPAAASLARLRSAGVVVLRTDRDGEVSLVRRGDGPWRLTLPGSPRRVPPRG